MKKCYYDDSEYGLQNLIELYDSFLLMGLGEGLSRITKAVNHREKIIIYGSYDVDGITSVSLLILILRYLNADVEYYIPDTMENEDVFNCNVIENHIKLLGADLIITVGCGINSFKEVELCRNLDIDVIITDYHTPKGNVPNTIVINPNQPECSYPCKDLNAVGVAYKLAYAIAEQYHMQCIEKFLDLVAIGIASSHIELKGENLVLMRKGMYYLTHTNNYGINAIAKINNINNIDDKALLSISEIVMPKINAVGRMDDARIAVELFTTDDKERAKQIAKYMNKKKKNKTKKITYETTSLDVNFY